MNPYLCPPLPFPLAAGWRAHGCATKVLTTLKLPQDMSPAEKAAAGAAAAAWRQELLQQQALLAELAERAEAAELALADKRLGGGAGSRQAQAQDDSSTKGRTGRLPQCHQ